ncbi:MAG: SAM-dependent methyltransferase, partial [Candidatus Hydrogenedentes bacterium]|nr:SAM-dependent methyltransferase [Candidatus Hydrogenedentota bacterium]
MSTANTISVQRRKRDLGQFFTPPPVAEFMAGLFDSVPETVRLLDPGAGAGALTRAMISRLCAMKGPPKRVEVSAFEIDTTVLPDLRATLERCGELCADTGIGFESTVYEEDFVAWGASASRADLFSIAACPFTTVIMNPPYRKIRSDSHTRWQLRSAGLETSNLYSGFLALAASLLGEDGELVAITPRSFCNGPYFRPFRERFLDNLSLLRIHVFESRAAAFRSDGVLQENVILHGRKGARQDSVIISSSDGKTFASLCEHRSRYEEVVAPDDPQQFIHIVADEAQRNVRERISQLTGTLAHLGLSVSTGRVVDFRAKEFLSRDPGPNTVPLIYPCHFQDGSVGWPKPSSRKPNAIVEAEATRGILVPNVMYVLVKRFSAK